MTLRQYQVSAYVAGYLASHLTLYKMYKTFPGNWHEGSTLAGPGNIRPKVLGRMLNPKLVWGPRHRYEDNQQRLDVIGHVETFSFPS